MIGTPDTEAEREVAAAMESVFPRIGELKRILSRYEPLFLTSTMSSFKNK